MGKLSKRNSYDLTEYSTQSFGDSDFPPNTRTEISDLIITFGQRDYLPGLVTINADGPSQECLGCGAVTPVGWCRRPWIRFYKQKPTPVGIAGILCPNCVCRLCEPTIDAQEFLTALQVASELMGVSHG